jgi:hypothetical protein
MLPNPRNRFFTTFVFPSDNNRSHDLDSRHLQRHHTDEQMMLINPSIGRSDLRSVTCSGWLKRAVRASHWISSYSYSATVSVAQS